MKLILLICVGNILWGVVEAWCEPLLIRRGLLVAFTKLRGFLSGCGSSPWSLRICLWCFYFYKVHSPTLLIFFRWLLSRCPLWITLGSGASVAPPLPLVSRLHLIVASSVLPGLHYFSIVVVGVVARGLSPSSLGVLGHNCLACNWRSSARPLSAFQALPCVLSQISPSWINSLCGESSMVSRTDWSLLLASSFVQVFFLAIFIYFSWRNAVAAQGACKNQQDWLSFCRGFFQSSDRMHMS